MIFSDPTLAVKHALKLQELFRLNSENLTYQDYTLQIRVGLHMGQVSVEDHIVSDVFGIHVNMASRIMSLAREGQVLVSGSVWENASGWLKDEHELNVFSVCYGKAQLKGIGKTTEIYEFYTAKSGKVGIPLPILLRKRKARWIRAFLILILISAIGIPLFYIILLNHRQQPADIKNDRGKMVLVNIVSSNNDIPSVVSWLRVLERIDLTGYKTPPLAVLPGELLRRINEDYQVRLKTAFISGFDIQTEDDLKTEYARKGLALPDKFTRDNLAHTPENLSYSNFWIIKPHVYWLTANKKYVVQIEIAGTWTLNRKNSGSSGIELEFLSDIDSVPILLEKKIQSSVKRAKNENVSFGKIVQINGEDILIKFEKDIIKPVSGVILQTSRNYSGPFYSVHDTAVVKRMKDLTLGFLYYKSAEKWISSEDTTDYNWTYSEYRDLQAGKVRFGGSGGLIETIGIEIKIMQVFDSIAIAKIYRQNRPWVELKVGDEVRLE
jgi:hypothetical protein